jgi:hypothetical protein
VENVTTLPRRATAAPRPPGCGGSWCGWLLRRSRAGAPRGVPRAGGALARGAPPPSTRPAGTDTSITPRSRGPPSPATRSSARPRRHVRLSLRRRGKGVGASGARGAVLVAGGPPHRHGRRPAPLWRAWWRGGYSGGRSSSTSAHATGEALPARRRRSLRAYLGGVGWAPGCCTAWPRSGSTARPGRTARVRVLPAGRDAADDERRSSPSWRSRR